MANLINESMSTAHLQELHSPSKYIYLNKEPLLLDNSTPFQSFPDLLFNVNTGNDMNVDLYVNDFISLCLY